MKGYEELKKVIEKVARTGMLETSEEKAIEYQDMIGHSTESQLAELANPENGELRRAFYKIHDVAYGTINTIVFYVNHSEKLANNIADQVEEAEKQTEERMKKIIDCKQKELENTCGELFDTRIKADKASEENERLKEIIESQRNEIINLKAKLFDYMNKEL